MSTVPPDQGGPPPRGRPGRLLILGDGFRLEVQPEAPRTQESEVWKVPEPERPKEAPPHWRWLSPLAEKVVRAADPQRWRTAEELAAAVEESASGEFRAVLRDLCERGVLVSSQGRGYRLSLTPP